MLKCCVSQGSLRNNNAGWRIWWRQGALALANDCLFYRHQYVDEAYKQQGITLQVGSLAPYTLEAEPSDSLFVHFEFIIIFFEKRQLREVAEKL